MTQDVKTMHIDPEDHDNLQRLVRYEMALKKISGQEPDCHRQLDVLGVEWKYDGTFQTWAYVGVPTDPPIEWVNFEVSAEVHVGMATVEQVEKALGFYNIWAFGDLYKLYGDWLDAQAKPYGKLTVYSDDLRRHWRQENERQERIEKYGRYSDSEVNFFIWCDIANKRVERNTEINWGGHDYPHWDRVQGEDRRSPILFTTTYGAKIEPTDSERMSHELARLMGRQHAMIRRFQHLLENEVQRIKL